MIKQENVTINGKAFIHTYSDEGKYVVRDGVEYDEAYDHAELGRTYSEGSYIGDEITDEEALSIIMGGAE